MNNKFLKKKHSLCKGATTASFYNCIITMRRPSCALSMGSYSFHHLSTPRDMQSTHHEQEVAAEERLVEEVRL